MAHVLVRSGLEVQFYAMAHITINILTAGSSHSAQHQQRKSSALTSSANLAAYSVEYTVAALFSKVGDIKSRSIGVLTLNKGTVADIGPRRRRLFRY